MEESEAEKLSSNIEIIKSTATKPAQRAEALKQIELFVSRSFYHIDSLTAILCLRREGTSHGLFRERAVYRKIVLQANAAMSISGTMLVQ